MTDLGRGQRVPLPDLGGTVVDVGVDVSSSENLVFDICCFGLDAAGRLVADEWLVFFNNPSAPGDAVRSLGPHGGDEQVFRVDLAGLPDTVERLVFTISIDGEQTMAAIARGHIRVLAGGSPLLRYPYYGADFTSEQSVTVGELYRRDGWRFAAVGQGFEGGLATLVTSFGAEVADEQAPAATSAPDDAQTVVLPIAEPEPEATLVLEEIPEPAVASVPASAAAEPAWALGPALSGPPVSYKVLTHKDKFFGGRFDPEKVGDAIASYASMGWQVVATCTDRQGRSRDSIVVLMVREN